MSWPVVEPIGWEIEKKRVWRKKESKRRKKKQHDVVIDITESDRQNKSIYIKCWHATAKPQFITASNTRTTCICIFCNWNTVIRRVHLPSTLSIRLWSIWTVSMQSLKRKFSESWNYKGSEENNNELFCGDRMTEHDPKVWPLTFRNEGRSSKLTWADLHDHLVQLSNSYRQVNKINSKIIRINKFEQKTNKLINHLLFHFFFCP